MPNLTDAPIEQIEAAVGDVAKLQIAIEPTTDSDIGQKLLAYKDGDASPQKVLIKNGVAPVLTADFVPIDPAVAPLAHKEGRLYYDTRAKAHTTMNDLSDVRHALGREILVRAKNNSGVTIPNGAPVYVAGVDIVTKTVSVALAKADDYDKSVILAVATVEIVHNASGDITGIGQVNGFDTSALSTGIVYLSTVAGEHTNTRPQYPAKPVITGYVLESHATTGSMQVAIANDAFDYEFDGTVIEQQDTFVVVDGTAVYAECELLGGGDLPVQLNGQIYLLDCTSGSGVGNRARALLTPGTATTKQFNFVYVELVGGVPTLKTSVTAPTGSFAFVSYVTIWSDLRTTSDGPALHQRSTDAKQHDDRGRIAHIDDKLRRLGTTYGGGVDPTPSIVTQAAALDDVGFVTTPGSVWQAHPQTMPAMDIATDGIFVANASGAGALAVDQKIYNLNEALELTDGTPISADRFVWVIFGCVNKTTGECKLWLNLPDKVYGTDASAYGDSDGSVSTSVPTSIYSTAFLICKLPARHTTPNGGTIGFVNPVGKPIYLDLRGAPLGISGSTSGGGGGAGVLNELGDVAITTPVNDDRLVQKDGLWVNKPRNLTINLLTGDDATTTFDVDTPENILVTGGSNNHTFDLGDATTYVAGERVSKIRNASSEFVIAQNSDLTVFEPIPPMVEVINALVNDSAAAGDWFVTKTDIPKNYGVSKWDDFIESVGTKSNLGWNATTSGTTGAASAIAGSGSGKIIGLRNLQTGTDPAGWVTLYLGSSSYRIGDMAHSMRIANIAPNALSTSDDTYQVEVGFGDNVAGASHTDAVLFRYHSPTSPNWILVVVAGGAVLTLVTSIPVTTANADLLFIVSSDGTRVDFWINKVHAGTHSAGIPTGAQLLGPNMRILKQGGAVGTTNRLIKVDAVGLESAVNTGRF